MDFFDDEPTTQTPADRASSSGTHPSRRRPDRRKTRIQRIVILAVILFVIVFGVAWWARSCQQNRKVSSYREYYDGVATAIGDSTTLGKQFNAIVKNPTRLQRADLVAKLAEMTTKQDEIAVRAGRFTPPGPLDDQQATFATGMRVRATGFKLLETAMLAALENKKTDVKTIAALDGYFSGPDAYYMDLVYLPSRTIMSDDGVTGVDVPTSEYYLKWTALDSVRIESMLGQVGSSSKLTGIHGVALLSVTARSGSQDIKLVKGQSVSVPASADLAFIARVQNQGSVAENDVPVIATIVIPGGGAPLTQEVTIASITAGQTQNVTIQGFNIPETALSKEVTLKIEAGPVPQEKVQTNNKAQFKLVLQLQ